MKIWRYSIKEYRLDSWLHSLMYACACQAILLCFGVPIVCKRAHNMLRNGTAIYQWHMHQNVAGVAKKRHVEEEFQWGELRQRRSFFSQSERCFLLIYNDYQILYYNNSYLWFQRILRMVQHLTNPTHLFPFSHHQRDMETHPFPRWGHRRETTFVRSHGGKTTTGFLHSWKWSTFNSHKWRFSFGFPILKM